MQAVKVKLEENKERYYVTDEKYKKPRCEATINTIVNTILTF